MHSCSFGFTLAALVVHFAGPAFAQEHAGHGGSTRSVSCKDASLACANAATPLLDADGTLWLAWTAGGAVSVARSLDKGKSFDPRVELARHDTTLDTGADARPQIVADGRAHIAVAYAFFRDRQWNAQVNVSTSSDGGKTFAPPRAISSDGSSQRFASLITDTEGRIFAAWIDKRLVASAARTGGKRPGGAIAYAWSSDGGHTFVGERIAYEDSCECCRIGVALTPRGLPALLFRGIFDGKVRDHVTQVFGARDTIQPARRVAIDNWVTDSCPHHGPALTVSGAGTLHAAWFTQGSVRSGTFYAYSRDGGAGFSEPVPVGNAQALSGRPALVAIGNRIWLAWKEFDGKRATVHLQRSDDDGRHWSAPALVAETTGYSDHPLLVRSGSRVYLSWLTRADGYRLIEIGRSA